MTALPFTAVTFAVAGSVLLIALRVLPRILEANGATFAVARLLLEEAGRQRGILFSLVLFVGCLSGLPLVLGDDYPLDHRIQSYLTYAQGVAGLYLSFLTVFFASRHIAGELGGGPASVLFTKPLTSTAYIVGKFVALALLNLLLVAVAGGIVFATVSLHFWTQPTSDEVRELLRSQVLVARRAVAPTPPADLIARVDERFAALDAEWIAERGGVDAVRSDLERQAELSWRSVSAGRQKTFLFEGLSVAREATGDGPPLQLRYRLYASPRPPDGRIDFSVMAGTIPLEKSALANSVEVLEVPLSALDVDGRLVLTVTGATSTTGEPVSIAFVGRDGLELLHPVGGFAANLARGMSVRWLRLTCLGMVTALGATFLSFAVAAVFSLTTLLVATSSPYVLQILGRGHGPAGHGHEGHGHEGHGHEEHVDEGFAGTVYEHVVEPVMGVVARVLGEYSRLPVTDRLVDGRVIAWEDVLEHVLWLGVGWSAVCGLLAVWILSRRELARVQV